ncbi:SRPBCC domain-containing protein [Flavobacterium sp. MDT1-60]|uniref:SRPBCC family protein n=1 Tax=Flavobacterium sp. MDT1-60 TaxID=1979344 RepID=UPI00177E3D17|nr:SRPBCC domain-containing protein [Flavobacterium sp. MDT1-60]QOG01354.1 SRPBCC domain-containing protein [Flavobacterium sp. MDT1-60]
MERSIKHQYFFAHSPEKVWQYLTNSDLMALWLMKNNFQPIVGTDFQFRINPIPDLNFDGIFYCTVLEIEPYKKLSYSWKSGPGDEKITLESVVIWKLEPTEKGTQVYLEHNGFDKDENLDFFNGLNHGWLEKFEKINNLLNP